MINRSQVARLTLALFMSPTTLIVLGCRADDGLGTRYPVTGTVKYKGEPVAKARISFHSTSQEGHGAGGNIENGSFSLTTLTPGDGAFPGEYIVTVDDREFDNAKLKAQAEKEFAKMGVAKLSMVPQTLQAKALKEAKGRFPGKYQIPETSDIKLTVPKGGKQFEIELKD